MNKATLSTKLSERLNISKKVAEDFVHAFQDIVTETLADDEEVTIAGFGTFSSRIRAARKGVNPRKPAETIDVPAVKVPKFKAGKALKDSLKASMGGKPVREPRDVQEVKPAASTPAAAPAPAPAPKPQAPAAPATPPPAEKPPTPPVPTAPQADSPKPNNPPIHM